MKRITGSLVVCVAAASFTAGALLFADDSQPTATANVATGAANAAPPVAVGAPVVGTPAVMTIADFGFSPLSVAPGATVTVTNTDGMPHTVTATGGEFASGLIEAGATVAFVAPTQPGTYTFFCDVHPTMQGTLVVA
jgi:plastocyanin